MQSDIRAMNDLRSRWFSGLDHGSYQDSVEHAVKVGDFIIAERNAIREIEGGWHCAQRIADILEQYYCWPVAHGTVVDEDGEPVALHYWNVTRDGWIIDAAADAHDDAPPDLRIIGPGCEAWNRYRPEWTADYNPDRADVYPELAGIQWTGTPDANLIAEREMGMSPVMI